jgi:hypothetical protein
MRRSPMANKHVCKVCNLEFEKQQGIESYGGRICPLCLKIPKWRSYYAEIFEDETDDEEAYFSGIVENDRKMRRYLEILEKDGPEAAQRFLTGLDP